MYVHVYIHTNVSTCTYSAQCRMVQKPANSLSSHFTTNTSTQSQQATKLHMCTYMYMYPACSYMYVQHIHYTYMYILVPSLVLKARLGTLVPIPLAIFTELNRYIEMKQNMPHRTYTCFVCVYSASIWSLFV